MLFDLEPLLRARLEQVAGLKGVYGLSTLDAEKARPTPCAYIAFDGARVSESSSDGRRVRGESRWLVVIAVKNVKQGDGAGAREDAHALASAVLDVLLGWCPQAVHQPLRLVDLPRPDYEAGLLWLPLLFEVNFILKGN